MNYEIKMFVFCNFALKKIFQKVNTNTENECLLNNEEFQRNLVLETTAVLKKDIMTLQFIY